MQSGASWFSLNRPIGTILSAKYVATDDVIELDLGHDVIHTPLRSPIYLGSVDHRVTEFEVNSDPIWKGWAALDRFRIEIADSAYDCTTVAWYTIAQILLAQLSEANDSTLDLFDTL